MLIVQAIPMTAAEPDPAARRGVLEWLLGLDQLSVGGETLELGWRHPLPPWLWALVVVAAAMLAWVAYRRLIGRVPGRVLLGMARGLIVLLVVALLAGPMLVLPREHVERDHVLMLVDRSASLTFADVIDPAAADRRMTRDAQLRKALTDHAPALQRIADQHRVDWLGFDETLRPVGSTDALGESDGPVTALRSALHQSLRRTTGKPISAIVVFSDGRSTEKIGAETIQRLNQRAAMVIAVPLGSAETPVDAAIRRVDAPQRAFVNDNVPVIVHLRRTGGDEELESPVPLGAVVRLIDVPTQQALDERRVRAWDEPVALSASVEAAGPASWRVELDSGADELIRQNNQHELALTLVDRAIRLLYVEGYPRWEYRYLRSLLLREDSVDASMMLISSDRTFAAEGDVALQRVPRSPEEWAAFDVIVLGDVFPDFFGEAQLRLIRQHVAERGAGLLYLGGPRAMPNAYATTALADLMPMRNPASVSRLPMDVTVQRTGAADVLGVLRLRSPFETSDTLWPADLPTLRWSQALGTLKPTAETLAIAVPADEPLLVRMRYGAGQVVYLGTDEIWRWRFGHGELYPQQFWMQMIRLLGRHRVQDDAGPGSRVQFHVSHRRASVNDTLVIELVITDQALLAAPRPTMPVRIAPEADTSDADQVLMLRSTDRVGHYQGLWQPRRPGRFTATLDDPALAALDIQRNVEVRRVEDESRDPATDHALLTALARNTGGQVVAVDALDQLPALLPDNTRRTAADISESLTTSPLAFALLLGLLIIEWVGRKLMRYA